MSQSNFIAGCLLVGFIVFITVHGELPQYKGIFTPSGGGLLGSFSQGNSFFQLGQSLSSSGAIQGLATSALAM
jgi:hypothetical protein